MNNYPLFAALAPRYMDKLIVDFSLDVDRAGAIMGNGGHESAGFTLMQEVRPLGGGRGGLGPFQWTGPRRVAYEAWLRRFGAKPGTFETDYAFLFRELIGPERAAIPALRRAVGLRDQVEAFEQAFERAGVKSYDSRYAWARRAIAAYRARPDVSVPSKPVLATVPTPITPPPVTTLSRVGAWFDHVWLG